MPQALESFVEGLIRDAKDPLLYDELTLRYVLREVLESIEDPNGISEDSAAYVAAIESAFRSLLPELDWVSFGIGSAWSVSVLLSDRLNESHDRAEEARRFRCFQKHLGVLKAVAAHPLFSHGALAREIDKTDGRLSQIVAELKANRLLLVDKLGRENRYELTSLAKHLLDDELSGAERQDIDNECKPSVADQAQQWVCEQGEAVVETNLTNACTAIGPKEGPSKLDVYSNARSHPLTSVA